MTRRSEKKTEQARVTPAASPMKTLLTWLVATDREFRVAQSMVDKFHNRF